MFVDDRYRLLNQLLNVSQKELLFFVTEGNSCTSQACSTGTSDSVYIGLRHFRQVVDEDVGKLVDVYATGRYICCYEDT